MYPNHAKLLFDYKNRKLIKINNLLNDQNFFFFGKFLGRYEILRKQLLISDSREADHRLNIDGGCGPSQAC